jgi:hypothetical protein
MGYSCLMHCTKDPPPRIMIPSADRPDGGLGCRQRQAHFLGCVREFSSFKPPPHPPVGGRGYKCGASAWFSTTLRPHHRHAKIRLIPHLNLFARSSPLVFFITVFKQLTRKYSVAELGFKAITCKECLQLT